MKELNFEPLFGFSSPHLQTTLASYLPAGKEPPSKTCLIELKNKDFLSTLLSTPLNWKESDPIVLLVHGMGGCHTSSYMIRMSRKLYQKGYKVVRVNLRGSGSGKGLSKLPYHAGTSDDILTILKLLKNESPVSEIHTMGFSLGGNIILKLAGELGSLANEWVNTFIAVCPPIDLAQTVSLIQASHNRFYHSYFVKHVLKHSERWNPQNIRTLYEFDEQITAPLWGYHGASEYYQKCSSLHFLPNITQKTHLLFAQDDPFIRFNKLNEISLPDNVHVWTTQKGGHVGFLGNPLKKHGMYWMDNLLLSWIHSL